VNPVTVEAEAIIPVGRDPANVAVGADAVWVPNQEDRTISRIDPRSNVVVATIATEYEPKAITVFDGAVWVAVSD
jgi:DNA-binding beta-propeller fold protein YncE